MNADPMTAMLLLNPLMTFEEVERELAIMRTAARKGSPEGIPKVTSRIRTDTTGKSSQPVSSRLSLSGTSRRG